MVNFALRRSTALVRAFPCASEPPIAKTALCDCGGRRDYHLLFHHQLSPWLSVHACVHACVRACVRVCLRACVRACVHACVRVRACMHISFDFKSCAYLVHSGGLFLFLKIFQEWALLCLASRCEHLLCLILYKCCKTELKKK
jgi:hypothetical protein